VKLPRNVSAEKLIRVLQRLDYAAIRQRGSHIRLRHEGPPTHSVTVPAHDPLKTGTLHGILVDVAAARGIDLESILAML
jgi:predicted RNA binding protein YcfA (HicA-like mRNA interferase family)